MSTDWPVYSLDQSLLSNAVTLDLLSSLSSEYVDSFCVCFDDPVTKIWDEIWATSKLKYNSLICDKIDLLVK